MSNRNAIYTNIGPFGFDEIFQQDALRDIYEFWLRNNGVKYAKETMAAWSMRLKEHGFYYNIYIRKLEGGMWKAPTDFIQFGMPLDAVANRDRTTISLVNVREELFRAIDIKQQPLPYPPTPVAHINYMLTMYGEDADHTAMSYVLPTFKELYNVPITEGNTVVTTEPVGNGQYRTHTMYGDEEYDYCKTSKCEICRWMTEDEPMAEDDDSTEYMGESGWDRWPSEKEATNNLHQDIINGNWGIIHKDKSGETAIVGFSKSNYYTVGDTIPTGTLNDNNPIQYYIGEIDDGYEGHCGYLIECDSNLYRLIKDNNNTSLCAEAKSSKHSITERDVDAAKLRVDINHCRWGIIRENDVKNTALVMREYSPDFKKGQTVETGSLYHRPLYYSDIHSGYWINRDSELYRLIKRNMRPNSERKTERKKAVTKVSNQRVRLSDEERAERKLLDDIIHWRVKESNDNTLIVRPVEGSLFFRRNRPFETIETGTLYHRPLVYSHKYGGYWIHRDCELARLILRNHNIYQ